MKFLEFIQSKAVADRLPFAVDFELLKVESDLTETVGKYEISLINELTIVESWFFDLLQENNDSNRRDFSLLVNQLSESLIQAMNLDIDRTEAAGLLVTGKEEWINDSNFLAFQVDNSELLKEFNSQFRQSQSTTPSDLLMVTFFMMTRCNPEWAPGQTAMLGTSQRDAIKDLIIREANGGVTTPVEDPDPQDEAEEVTKK